MTTRKVAHVNRLLRSVAWFALLLAVALTRTVPSAGAAEVQVLVLAGQSNAVGYGSDATFLPPALAVPQTDIRFRFDE